MGGGSELLLQFSMPLNCHRLALLMHKVGHKCRGSAGSKVDWTLQTEASPVRPREEARDLPFVYEASERQLNTTITEAFLITINISSPRGREGMGRPGGTKIKSVRGLRSVCPAGPGGRGPGDVLAQLSVLLTPRCTLSHVATPAKRPASQRAGQEAS